MILTLARQKKVVTMLNNVRAFPENPLHEGICRSIAQLQLEHTERRPEQAQLHFWNDLAIYRCWGILSKAEKHLAIADPEGAKMIKELIEQQWQKLRPMVQAIFQEHMDKQAFGVSVSLSAEEDEMVILVRVREE